MSKFYQTIERNNLMTNRELDFHYGQILKEKKQDRMMKIGLIVVATYFIGRIIMGLTLGI